MAPSGPTSFEETRRPQRPRSGNGPAQRRTLIARPNRRTSRLPLAQQMMSEVLQQEYEEDGGNFGTESGESSARSDFDDMDDYNGWNESPPTDKAGTALSGYTGWTIDVDVQKVWPDSPTWVRSDGSADKGLRLITVTVTDPNSNQTTIYGLRSDTGAMEQRPEVAGTFVTWVGAALQVGSNATQVIGGTNLTNHAFDQ